jgi:hypothetical protein
MQGLIPLLRKRRRQGRLSYPLSATTSLGPVRGLPVARVGSASFTSACWALATSAPMGKLWLSTTSISLLPLPRRVSPICCPLF